MRKTITAALSALLVAGGIALASPAVATETPPTECVPSEAWTEVIHHEAVGEPTIPNPAYVPEVPAIPAVYVTEYKFVHKFDIFELQPKWSSDPNWNAEGNEHSKGWIKTDDTRETLVTPEVPAVPAVGEPTIPNPAYVPAYDEMVEHPEVTCEPETVDPIVCSATGDWYTEGDDLAPSRTEDGLVFAGGSGAAVGYRLPVTGNLQGWTSLSFVNSGGQSEFFFRIVIDASADGGPAYKSLSFPGYTTVDQASISYQYGESISDTAERFPHAVITSIGFQTNSAAPAGYVAVLSSVTSDCGDVDFTWPPLPEPTYVPGEWSEPVITCDNEVGDEVTITREVVVTTYTRGENGEAVPHEETVTENDVYVVTEADVEALECPTPEPTPTPTAEPTPTATPTPAAAPLKTASDDLAETGTDPLSTLSWLTAGAGAVALGGLLTVLALRRRQTHQQ